MKQIYLTVLGFLAVFAVHAQRDTVFWFAVPEITQDSTYPGGDLDRPIYLHLASFSNTSIVTITQPAIPSFIPIVRTITAGNSVVVDLTPFITQLENIVPDFVSDYGLKITATQPIQAYYEEASRDNPELFTLKGRNALGTNFFIPSQKLLDNVSQYTPSPYSSFDLVATEDNTSVTITPSNNIVGHTAGVAFNITLNKGQTFSSKATSKLASQHLDGSIVSSNKPIAITIKDDLLNASPVYQPAHDIGGDQIVPINKLGVEYIAVRGRLKSPFDKVFVLATQNGTTITQDGTPVGTINAGITQTLSMNSTATYIQTSSPVYVLQLTGHGGEVGIDVLPPIECTGSSEVAFTRATADSLFFMLLVKNGGQGNFLFNGSSSIINASSFVPVPGTANQWYSAFLIISTANLPLAATAIVQNTTNLFHMGVINGNTGGGVRFGYFSNFNSFFIQANSNGPLCPGQQLQLSSDTIVGATYTWTGPNGFNSSLQNPINNNFTVNDTGLYTLNADYNGCTGISTAYVGLNTGSALFNLGNDTTYCGNFTRTLNTGNATTLWSTGVTATSITVNNPGTYWAEVNTACGTFRDSIVIAQTVVPILNIGNDTTYCGSFTRTLTTGDATTVWSTGVTAASITVNMAGTYWAEINNSCGLLRDSIIIKTDVSSLSFGADTAYCNAFTRILVANDSNAVWNTGVTAPSITVNNDGIYWAHIVNTCGTFDDTITITQVVTPVFNLGNDTSLCQGQHIIVNAPTGSGYTYFWNTGETTSGIQIDSAAAYWVQLTDSGCITTDSINVFFIQPPVTFSLGTDTTFCGPVNITLTTDSSSTIWSTGVTSANIQVNQPGVYWATISNICGSVTDSIVLFQNLPIPFVLISDTAICTTDSIVLNINVAANYYLWSTGSITNTITVNTPGIYWAEAWDTATCKHRDSIIVAAKEIPIVSLGADTTICGDNPYILNAGFPYSQYVWQDGSTDSSYSVAFTGTYNVTVTNACGETTDSVNVEYLFDECALAIPTGFTPNNDGNNDRFRVISRCPIEKFELHVYNRWGELVYESTDPTEGWDGTYNNTQQPLSTFIYYIQYYNYCQQKIATLYGNVTLVR